MAENKAPLAAVVGNRRKKQKLSPEEKKEQGRQNNADRQARFRARRRQEAAEFTPGQACVVPIRFSAADSAHIGKAMKVRAIWSGSEYTLQEYVVLALLHDADRLNRELKELGKTQCKQCGKIPPEHCDGLFKGQGDCWLTRGALELKV
ncbi:hypothetical protein ACK33C_22380 [Aeromonas hydrophila]|uniref:hypothetical protein n=1 Tax=Aeromonas hydrophila TaxID=644 RepID=UPI0039875C96